MDICFLCYISLVLFCLLLLHHPLQQQLQHNKYWNVKEKIEGPIIVVVAEERNHRCMHFEGHIDVQQWISENPADLLDKDAEEKCRRPNGVRQHSNGRDAEKTSQTTHHVSQSTNHRRTPSNCNPIKDPQSAANDDPHGAYPHHGSHFQNHSDSQSEVGDVTHPEGFCGFLVDVVFDKRQQK